MRKRLWIVLCLIALEGIFSWSDWKDSQEILRVHQAALALHAKSEAIKQNRKLEQAQAAPAGSQDEGARQLDEQAWQLLETGMHRSQLVWQSLALLVMLALLFIGLRSYFLSQRDAVHRELAEFELLTEQSSLARRIEDRTAELQSEVEVRRRAEELNKRQKRVLELLASDGPLDEIFRELTASVASQRRSWESAIHLLDGDTGSLRLVASSRVSGWLEHYLRDIAVKFSDAPESMACTSGAPSFIGTMNQQKRPWSEFLVSNGIRSAWSLPLVLSDGNVSGTLTVYSRLFGLPDDEDRDLLDSAVRLASLVVDVRRMNSELLRKAYEDELTGVANRRAGEIRLQEAMARSQSSNESFAVLLIDLDRFKRLNDLYGHERGDLVLREVSRRIATHPRVNGSMARMGGDEFLVVLESCSDDNDAREMAGELAALISEPMEIGREITTVGASIGITIYPRDGATADELERHADAAMYQAKRRSMSWCAFSSVIREEVDSAISIEEGLIEALEAPAEQSMLEVLYQPIYTAQGDLLEFEALLRFKHPRLGVVSPARFIPVAEESKLIIPVGRWVFREVCRQIVAWEKAGYPPVRVAVNISAVQCGREDFIEEVRSVIEEYGVSPTALTLELTESAVMQNATRAGAHMRELKKMGVRVAMDDFGTGYSSLSYLHTLPLDILKVDRSFVARLGQADDSRAIVESIISMAHVLGMVTIGEGVETDMQRSMLVDMGCDALQGYLFARPLRSVDAGMLIGGRALETRNATQDAAKDGAIDTSVEQIANWNGSMERLTA